MKLTPKKELAARLIAQGETQADTYRDPRISVTKQTMSNWNQEEDFIKRVEELQTDTTAQVEEILMKSAADAAEVLVSVVRGKNDEDDSKIVGLKLKSSLWVLERILGKNEKLKTRPILDSQDEEDEFAPDEDEMDSIIDAIK